MRTSETTAQLVAALAAAQSEVRNVAPDATNPHLKNRYVTLASLTDASRALARHGIATLVSVAIDGPFFLATLRLAKGDEWIEIETAIPLPADVRGTTTAQMVGGLTTYARRQLLGQALNIAPDPDADGNDPPPAPPSSPPALATDKAQALARARAAYKRAARAAQERGEDPPPAPPKGELDGWPITAIHEIAAQWEAMV